MTSFDNIVREVKQEKFATELYRFQGAKSFNCFDIRTSKFVDKQNPNYVFISSSLDHHKYFTARRLRQLLNRVVLKDSPYQICLKSVSNLDSYNEIKSLILNSESINNLYRLRFLCHRNMKSLLYTNATRQIKREEKKPVERVDARVFGGGYGVAQEWQSLLAYMTYLSAYQKIDREAILAFLGEMKRNSRIINKDNLNFLLEEGTYNYRINPHLTSSFTKYEIMEALEVIIDKGLCLEGSPLTENPTQTIQEVVTSYEKGKEKVLSLIDKKYKSKVE